MQEVEAGLEPKGASPLNCFYLPVPNSPRSNMITHPLMLDSLHREATFREHIYTQQQKVQQNVGRMDALMKEFKKRSVNIDHDRMARLMKENEQLRKLNRKMSDELKVLREELEECKDLLTKKGLFALKVRFHQGCQGMKDRLDSFRQFVVKEIEEVKARVKKLEHQLYVKQMVVKKQYQKIRLSDSIEALDPPQNKPTLENFVFGRRRKIFQYNQDLRSMGNKYYVMDQQNRVLSLEDVQDIKEAILGFQQKINELVGKIRDLQMKKNQKMTLCSSSQTMKIQAILAESKLMRHDSDEFLSLLKRIEIIQADLNNLDSSALKISQRLKRQSPQRLYSKHRTPEKYNSTPHTTFNS